MDTLNFNDKRYEVIRVIRLESFENDAEALIFKNYCHSETILKRDGKYYFCNEISDVEIIENEK